MRISAHPGLVIVSARHGRILSLASENNMSQKGEGSMIIDNIPEELALERVSR